jgi:hypothetical protein
MKSLKYYTILGVLLFIASANLSFVFSQEICLTKAWDSFNKGSYNEAIKFSDQCIEDFGRIALQKQQELERANIQEPPVGKVNPADKKAIFGRGLLNDVATACWIKGQSYEYLYKSERQRREHYKRMAERAYREIRRYKYGRTFDNTRDIFWSPFEAANARLPIQ